MGKIRYAKKDFQHPYKPWSDDHNDKEGKHYRGFKACQNCVEWTVYTVPSLWLFVLYTPALEVVPKVGPVVAPYLPLAGGAAFWERRKSENGKVYGTCTVEGRAACGGEVVAAALVEGVGWACMPRKTGLWLPSGQ